MMYDRAKRLMMMPSSNTTSIGNTVVEADPELVDSMRNHCKTILHKHSNMTNLVDTVYSIVNGDTYEIRIKHQEFIKALVYATLKYPYFANETIKIFIKLLSFKRQHDPKVFSMNDFTLGLDTLVKEHLKYIKRFPHIMPFISTIIASLLNSRIPCFEFSNLKDCYKSLSPVDASHFFIDVLKIMTENPLDSWNANVTITGIIWLYNKWSMSNYIPINVFVPISHINKYYKHNISGGFILTISIFDKMRCITDSNQFYSTMRFWLIQNFNPAIIKSPQFLCALTTGIIMYLSLKTRFPKREFFTYENVKLIIWFFKQEPHTDIAFQERLFQCIHGVQLMSPLILGDTTNLILKLYGAFHLDRKINKESFQQWENAYNQKIANNPVGARLKVNEMLASFYQWLEKTFNI